MTRAILLHGVGLDHTMWERVTPLLAKDFTVSTPDLPGHGRARAVGPGTTLTDLTEGLAELAEQPAHLVGFSLGALVATRFALNHPDRVASLTLVSTVANRSPAQAAAVADRLAAARADLDATYEAAVQRWFSPHWHAAEPQLAARVRATLRANRPASYLACYAVFAQADAELWPQLPGLRAPSVAITGGDDPGSTPDMAAALAQRVPHGRWRAVPGARHLLPLERPQEVAAAVLAAANDRPL